jgi:L-ascorbate metabolism protein UlaG (beta-lactamase superfamily)
VSVPIIVIASPLGEAISATYEGIASLGWEIKQMKKTVLIAFIVISLAAAAWPRELLEATHESGISTVKALVDKSSKPESLLLTYIANAGVLISSGDRKVLIDALFDKPHKDYRAPSPEVLDKIMKGEAPFDGVDLVLVTHNHPDHFDAPLAAAYLRAFRKAVLLAPEDAVAELRKTADGAAIGPRVVSLDLRVGEKNERTLKGIKITALRTLHSGDKESPMNIAYLFEIGGRRVFHEGDSNGKPDVLRALVPDGSRVDLALVHYWFPLEPGCAAWLQKSFTAEHIALMHLPIRLEGDAPGKIDMVRKYYKDIFLMLPGMPRKTFL